MHETKIIGMGMQLIYNWGSEASPTLGCSIEILRDIYICMSVGLSTIVYGNPYKKWYAKMRGRNYVVQTRACSKSVL